MLKSFIILACVAVIAVILDMVLARGYDAKAARLAKKHSIYWDVKDHRNGLVMKDHLAFHIITLLLGGALYYFKEPGWIRFAGLGLAAVYFAFCVFRLIYVYAHRDGRLAKDNFFRKSFSQYMFTTFVGNRFLLSCLSSLAVALVWAFVYR